MIIHQLLKLVNSYFDDNWYHYYLGRHSSSGESNKLLQKANPHGKAKETKHGKVMLGEQEFVIVMLLVMLLFLGWGSFDVVGLAGGRSNREKLFYESGDFSQGNSGNLVYWRNMTFTWVFNLLGNQLIRMVICQPACCSTYNAGCGLPTK